MGSRGLPFLSPPDRAGHVPAELRPLPLAGSFKASRSFFLLYNGKNSALKMGVRVIRNFSSTGTLGHFHINHACPLQKIGSCRNM